MTYYILNIILPPPQPPPPPPTDLPLPDYDLPVNVDAATMLTWADVFIIPPSAPG